MRPRRRLVVIAAIVLVAAATGGCARHALHPPAASPDARPGGTLVVGIGAPASVDPANAADPAASLVVRTMCDSLIQFDPTTGAMKPAIAESWLISDAGRRFTVKLRKGVTFHDGREVTAEDVVFSLSRVASEQAASPLAPLLEPIQGFEQVHGEEDVREERLRKRLRGLRVIEKYSFEVNLSRSDADFINVLGHTLASPVPKRVAERDPSRFDGEPVCAGPYQLAEPWHPGADTITLRRSDHYRPVSDAYAAGGRGYADEIQFRVLPDKSAQLDAFREGTLDVAHGPRNRLSDDPAAQADLIRTTSPSLEYIGLPARLDPFDSPAVRIALSQALDRRAIISSVFLRSAEPAQGFLPPSLGSTFRPSACGEATPADGDVEGARATLARAHVDLTGKLLRFYFNDDTSTDGVSNRNLAQAVRAQWEAAFGVTVVMVPVPWDGYLTLGHTVNGFDGPFRLSWSSPYPSADAYLAPLFASGSIGLDNFSHFAHPDFDRVLDRVARRAGDAVDRRLEYSRLEDLACREMPVIPLDFPTTNHVIRRSHVGAARGTFTDRTSGDIVVRELFVRS